MQSIIDFLIANKMPVGGVLIAIVAFWDKIKAAFAAVKEKVKIPSFGGSVVVDDEEADQDALRHLRNRAVAIGNVELLALIKEIDTRFYDIHTGIKNAK
jgi:hypothetical protein